MFGGIYSRQEINAFIIIIIVQVYDKIPFGGYKCADEDY